MAPGGREDGLERDGGGRNDRTWETGCGGEGEGTLRAGTEALTLVTHDSCTVLLFVLFC